jgi:hypothetical protein
MKSINYKTIPNSEHRYPTVGDYWETADSVEVRVSSMSDVRFEQLVLIHELVEIFLMQHRKIVLDESDKFDILFEKEREEGKHGVIDEPGDDPRCPYGREHRFAENIERMLAHELGVDWNEYTKTVMEL